MNGKIQGKMTATPIMHVQEGTTVASLKEHGSEEQKLVANFFDVDKNGVFDTKEADALNNCTFTSTDGTLTIYDKSQDKNNPTITTIKYGNDASVFDNKINSYEAGFINIDGCDTGSTIFNATSGNITIDLPNNQLIVKNAKASIITSQNLYVENSDIDYIGAFGDKVELKNVKDKGIFLDTSTDLHTLKKD